MLGAQWGVFSRHPNGTNLDEELEFTSSGWCTVWSTPNHQPSPSKSVADMRVGENDDRDVPRRLAKLGFAFSHGT